MLPGSSIIQAKPPALQCPLKDQLCLATGGGGETRDTVIPALQRRRGLKVVPPGDARPGSKLEPWMSVSPSPPHAVLSRVQALRHLPAITLFLVSFEMPCLCIQQLVTCSVNIQEAAMTSPRRWYGDGVTGVSKVMEAREVVGSAGANPPD